jgi:hypothetical protein
LRVLVYKDPLFYYSKFIKQQITLEETMNDDLPIDFEFLEDSLEALELGCYIGFCSNCDDISEDE